MLYEKGSFTVVPNLSNLKGLKPNLQTMFLWLCHHANQEGVCFPGHKLLAKETGVSVRTIIRGLEELRKLGFIRKKKRVNDKTKGQMSNLYLMLVQKKGGGDKKDTGGSDTVSPITISKKNKLYPDNKYNKKNFLENEKKVNNQIRVNNGFSSIGDIIKNKRYNKLN